jgi:predicted DNA-binding transcriptional regulator YafY
MSTPKDTISRLLTLAQLIPPTPRRISTTTLLEKLIERGYKLDARTLQRDLIALEDSLSLIRHKEEKPYRWSRNNKLHLQELNPSSALALHLAETQLHKLLPQSVSDQLIPLFSAAHQHLNTLQHNSMADWAKVVRTLPNGKALIPAPIDSNVWQQVTDALLNKQQLRVNYSSRTKGEHKQLLLNPLGLVSRYTITYLVAGVDGYSDPRQFALHRIINAECTNTSAPQNSDFDLDSYIASGAFSLRQTTEMVELIADIHPQQAWLLKETPLSTQQELTPLPDSDWFRLTATVPLDQETLWWIFGLNERIRVYAPQVWVEEIRVALNNLQALYQEN